MGKRPLGITVLGTFSVLGGIGLLLVAISNFLAFLAATDAQSPSGVPPGALLVNAAVGFFLGLFLLLRGRGYLKLRPWAWWVTTLALFIGILFAFLVLAGGGVRGNPGVIGFLLPGLLLLLILFGYFLSVRGYFRGETT